MRDDSPPVTSGGVSFSRNLLRQHRASDYERYVESFRRSAVDATTPCASACAVLQLLTDKRYLDVQVGADFKASDLLTPRRSSVALRRPVFRTHEQMALLSRRCLAEMLSEESATWWSSMTAWCTPACELLATASSSCQILLCTCHPEPLRVASTARAGA